LSITNHRLTTSEEIIERLQEEVEECRAEVDKLTDENFDLVSRLGRKEAHTRELEERLDSHEETLNYLCSLVRKRKRPENAQNMVVDTTAPVEDTTAPVEETPAPEKVMPARVEGMSAPVDATSAPVDSSSAPVDGSSAPVDVMLGPVEEEVTSATNVTVMGPPPPPKIPTPAVTIQPPTPQTSQEDQAPKTHLAVPPKDPEETARPRPKSRSRSPALPLGQQRRSPRFHSRGLSQSPPSSSKRPGEPLDNEPPAKKTRDC
jgi:hypothetical protein